MLKVKLINHTADPEKMVAIAARMCYSPLSAKEMVNGLTKETIDKMVTMAAENHHDSLMEHVTFTFIIEGVSRALSHQLVRHRIATYHQRSQRYVTEGELPTKVVIPPSVQDNPKAKDAYMDIIIRISNAYKYLIELGIKKEDARYLLPNATETQLVMTMNARELIHFFGLRLCNRAQEEIRLMAGMMLDQCRKVSPSLFNNIGPNCYMMGHCPEGKMSCGCAAEKMEKFKPEKFHLHLEEEIIKWF